MIILGKPVARRKIILHEVKFDWSDSKLTDIISRLQILAKNGTPEGAEVYMCVEDLDNCPLYTSMWYMQEPTEEALVAYEMEQVKVYLDKYPEQCENYLRILRGDDNEWCEFE